MLEPSNGVFFFFLGPWFPQRLSLPKRGSNVSYQIFADHVTTGRVALVSNPKNHWFVFCAGCETRRECVGITETVEVQARVHQCRYATNGGPFGGPTCITPVISNNTIMSDLVLTEGYQCIAMTRDSGDWLLGNISRALYPTISNLFCGFNWLVVNNSVLTYNDTEIAPRTAFGVDALGRMISLVAEGSEVAHTGLTLNQTAVWMSQLGAKYAINLDGGGSSTSWWHANGGVQGCPTCMDEPFCCLRSVTTINCLY